MAMCSISDSTSDNGGVAMSQTMVLTARDGHRFVATVAGTVDAAKGGVVILQEIFGLNAHIRTLPARFAAAGYYAIAPALFDRAETGVELGYDAAGKTRGLALKAAVDAETLFDVEAAIAEAAKAGPVAVVGYCWGGSLAWRSAVTLPGLAAAIAYYGGELPARLNERPNCPLLAHFGARDASIPMEAVDAFTAAQANSTPPVTVHVYDADHGFNCDSRAQYDATAATLAFERTLAFLATHLG